MSPQKNSLVTDLVHSSWWVSIAVGAVCYSTLKWILPSFEYSNKFIQLMVDAGEQNAYIVAIVFLVISAVSILRKLT